MQVKELVIPYSYKQKIKLYTTGDAHTGTKYCAEDKLKEKVKEIKSDKTNLWVDMGDKCEFITPSDPRWDTGTIRDGIHDDNIATDQENLYCSLYDSIQSQCAGLLEGNHEDAIRIHNHCDVQKNICDKLKVDNLGYTCFLKLIFRRKNSNESHVFIGFLTHGSGSAVTKGAKLNKLQRMMDAFEADFYAVGHMHEIITDEKPYLTLDSNNQIKHKIKVGAITGCWFRTYTQDMRASYGEKRTYSPTTIGCPVFTFDPGESKVSVSY